jgi:uncharacterized protein YecA (UPF0149 family)
LRQPPLQLVRGLQERVQVELVRYLPNLSVVQDEYVNHLLHRAYLNRDRCERYPTLLQQDQQQAVEKVMPRKVDPKIGRNDPCHCGSGKKYKNCHGKP